MSKSSSEIANKLRVCTIKVREIYEEGKAAGLPKEALTPIAMAYLNMAQSVVLVKNYSEVKRELPVLRVVK